MKVIPASEFENYLGQETGVTDWIEITQERINQFADATNDHQFIHVDPEAAKAAPTPLDTTIAHGFLTLSLVSYIAATSGFSPAQMQTAVNYGSDKVRFMEAVPVNSKIRGKFVLTEAQYKKNGRSFPTKFWKFVQKEFRENVRAKG